MKKFKVFIIPALLGVIGITLPHLPKKLAPLSETIFMKQFIPTIEPLEVVGCRISQRSQSAVERCYLKGAPGPQVFTSKLNETGWRPSAHHLPLGVTLGAWCKGESRFAIAQEDNRWVIEYSRAVGYSCEEKRL